MKNYCQLKIIFFFLAVWLTNMSLQAQPPAKTQEENDLLKYLLKKVDSVKRIAENQKKDNRSINTSSGSKQTTIPQKNKDNEMLPGYNSAKARSIPKKILSPEELHIYLINLYNQLCSRLPSGAVSSAKSIAAKLDNHPGKLEAAALVGWQNRARDEAVILIMKAATLSNDGLLLSNAGGFLDMYGLPEKAIPVLRTVVNQASQNAIALNNLGQAYTALGMLDSAMTYISRCLRISPQHPEANCTAGLIELKKGNKEKAQAYFENSISGGFNFSALRGLATIFKDNKEKLKIAHLIKPKVKKPEYFNQFKYNKLPRQCYNVFEAATVEKELYAYKKILQSETMKFYLLGEEAKKAKGKNWVEETNKKNIETIIQGKPYLRPFQILGFIMLSETEMDYNKDIADLQKFYNENREHYTQLGIEYKKAFDQLAKSGDNTCAKENELKNKYLEQFAQLNKEWQSRYMLVENKYIDDLLFWCYFAALDLKDYRTKFYALIRNYIHQIDRLAVAKILEPCKKMEPKEIETPVPNELHEFDCPVDVEIGFAVGKLTMDCEKFSFKAGEGIVFKYEKNFISHRESTISIGAGVGLDASEKVGPVKTGFSAGIDMSVYFTFDMAGNCSDAGVTYNASVGGGLNFSAGERIKIKRDLSYMGAEVGWRFGINSGPGFTTTDFMKDKPEVPVNKNVKIYNSN